ncbi:tetratricopeptide repeat protein [Candidatus Dependentiae bacterium]
MNNMGKIWLLHLCIMFTCFMRGEKKPYSAIDYSILSEQLRDNQQLAIALISAQQALALEPHSSKTRILAGEILMQLHREREAEKQFDKALQYKPCQHEVKLKLANNLFALGNHFYARHEIERALQIYKKTAQLFPYSSAIQHNVGFALAELNRPHEAIKAYEKALTIQPDLVETHFCLSTAYLAAGNYKKGWAEYEWRWKKQGKDLHDLPYPIWQGEPLEEKTLLIRAEGALGDTIHFLRYAQLIKKPSVTIVLQALSPLKTLLAQCDYIDAVITNRDKKPPIDFQVSSMSLPYLLQTNIDTVPNKTPYLHASDDLVRFWKETLFDHTTTFNIGICWQADPYNDAQRPPFARRNVPLKQLDPLAQLPNVALFSLQKDGTTLVKDASFAVHTFGDYFDNTHGRFMDTAAVIKNLDLVISVDTSVAHLAGALGVKTWVLLPFKSDWRWMTDRTDSPWYPKMKLFRNQKTTDWSTVMQQVCQELKKIVKKKGE